VFFGKVLRQAYTKRKGLPAIAQWKEAGKLFESAS
jgi:hypothetical protein